MATIEADARLHFRQPPQECVDGTRVVNDAQWRSRADFKAMTRNESARPHMAAAARLATFDSILCEVEPETCRKTSHTAGGRRGHERHDG